MTPIFARFAGSVIFILACVALSLEVNRGKREEIRALELSVSLISSVKREISFFSTPLPRVLSDFFASYGENIPEGFCRFALDEPSRAVEYLPLCVKEREVLSEFLSSVGRSYSDDEVKLCDFYLEKMTAVLDSKKSAYPRESKTRSLTSLLFACTAAVLFI